MGNPVRKVRQSGRNILSTFPSVKTGIPVACESTIELDLCYLLELSPHVTSYLAQPFTISAAFQDGAAHSYTPLFSVDVRLADWNGPLAILHEADVMHVHGALEVMWQLLTDWPNSWYSALARLAELEQREATVISRFPRALFAAPQLAGPEFRWLRLSYVDFVRSHVGKRPGVLRWYRAYPGLRRAWDESLPTLPELLSRQRVRELAQGEDKHVYDYFIEVEREAASQPIAEPRPEYENRSLMAEVVRPWTPTVGYS